MTSQIIVIIIQGTGAIMLALLSLRLFEKSQKEKDKSLLPLSLLLLSLAGALVLLSMARLLI